MNNTRRKALREISSQLEELKAVLQELVDEEEEYRDNIPENLQSSERYEKADYACDRLNDAIYSFDDIISNIDEATE